MFRQSEGGLSIVTNPHISYPQKKEKSVLRAIKNQVKIVPKDFPLCDKKDDCQSNRLFFETQGDGSSVLPKDE